MAAYVKVAHAADLPPGQAMAVTVGDKRIALFSVDGTVVATDDTCTHRGGPLSEGELKDGIVTCPWHGAQFSVKDGQQLTWARFYSLKMIGERSKCVRSLKGRLAFLMISKHYRQMYANTGIATDSARHARSTRWARWLASPCRRFFMASPMPELNVQTNY